MKTIKEQADSYVEMFRPYAYTKDDRDYNHPSKTYNSIKSAIIHVEGLIQELEIMYHLCCPEINIAYYKSILTELKSRI